LGGLFVGRSRFRKAIGYMAECDVYGVNGAIRYQARMDGTVYLKASLALHWLVVQWSMHVFSRRCNIPFSMYPLAN
jgi:hypothetical protein